ncbi:ATP-binding cassette domain-containing protein [Thiomicrorhabdus sp.]|uniref:ATP-binding cassette domain-containing protein n=1 Tax=Thiomicrorhabdus sp. TaxID=2039724 RepID=UPI0029C5FD21|nr:ATP-binding cassette domain-containing protein [Thiomicrorhabdus sp.]
MTQTTLVTLDRVRYQHANGQGLFDTLSETFDRQPTGLVGDNGCGKSTLAKIIAGELAPSDGSVACTGRVFYVPQNIRLQDSETVVDLLQIRAELAALTRIEQGSSDSHDFELLADRWLLREKAQDALNHFGLPHLRLTTPVVKLSGGEITQVALIGAFISEADFLILDEPTNHLDRDQRRHLHQLIRDWKNGLLVISHDRELLNLMERILELSSTGLQSYGGNFDFYLQQKQHEQQVLAEKLERARLDRKKGLQALQQQKERQQKRQNRASKAAKQTNQSKALLDFQKNRSQLHSGKLSAQTRTVQIGLDRRVSEAEQAVIHEADYCFFPLETVLEPHKQVLQIDNLTFPYGLMPKSAFSLHFSGPQRMALTGANGCGKSTLLKMIAGQVSVPEAGRFICYVKTVYIDQHASLLEAEQTVLQQLLMVSNLTETEARQKLAQIALSAQKMDLKSCLLSGGERIKASLLIATLQQPTPKLLLLDEPTNHIDYRSKQALIKMLNQYQGALMIASHDGDFLNALHLTHQLKWKSKGQVPSMTFAGGGADDVE